MIPTIKKFAASILALVAVLVAHTSEAEAPKRMRVAALLGLTGGAAYHSKGIRQGVELAADDLKKSGWQIDLRFEDDQTNSAKTVSAMQFLSSQGYRLFIGPTWSFQVNAVRTVVPQNNIVAMAPAGSSDINGGAAEGVFNLCPARTRQVPYVAEWLKKQGYRRGFILTPNGDWGEIHRQVFASAMKDAGGTVLGEEQFDYGIDLSTLKTILVKANQRNPDVVFTTGSGGDVGNIVRARNMLNLHFAVLSTDDIHDALDLRLLTKEELQNEVFAVGLTVGADFEKRYFARFGESPSLYSDRGYDALMILAQAVEKTDGAPNSIRSYLRSGAVFSGVSGNLKFDSRGDAESGEYHIVKAAS